MSVFDILVNAGIPYLRSNCKQHLSQLSESKLSYKNLYIKVNESRNKPGVAQRVPGRLGSQIP